MKINIHPIVIPGDIKISRQFKAKSRHTDSKPLEQKELLEYDCKTLFFDVFFDPNNRILYAIGPTLLNLKHEIPVTLVQVNGVSIPFTLESINAKVDLLKAPLPQNFNITDENQVRFTFGEIWHWEKNIARNRIPFELTQLTLSTIQKDNEIRWIRDWMKYYQQAHGVETFIIYDNNSVYQRDLEEKIDLPDANLLIVNWNFPYGPVKSHGNQFCQPGSLNHCRLRFGGSGFCMNFDIDELLVTKSKSLLNLLKSDVTYFDSYFVPAVDALDESYSFRTFFYREKLSRIEDGRYQPKKYIYRFNSVCSNLPHDAVTKKQKKWYAVNKILSKFEWLSFFRINLLDLQSKVVPISEAYFLHYKAISSGWKWASRFHAHKDLDNLTEDYSVLNVFKDIDEYKNFP